MTLSLILIFIITACSSKKNILYLQESNDNISVQYKDYLLQTDDIIKVTFNGLKPSVALGYSNENLSTLPSTLEVMKLEGFQVNQDGFINIVGIGEVLVHGLSISDLVKKLKNTLITKGLLTEPSVDVKLLNASFTIIGDVAMPGRYNFLKNNLNIFEAIGMAGDLNITGKRDNIKLIRTIDNKKTVVNVDLTKLPVHYHEAFAGQKIRIVKDEGEFQHAEIVDESFKKDSNERRVAVQYFNIDEDTGKETVVGKKHWFTKAKWPNV